MREPNLKTSLVIAYARVKVEREAKRSIDLAGRINDI
jgi:hypothetical protein